MRTNCGRTSARANIAAAAWRLSTAINTLSIQAHNKEKGACCHFLACSVAPAELARRSAGVSPSFSNGLVDLNSSHCIL